MFEVSPLQWTKDSGASEQIQSYHTCDENRRNKAMVTVMGVVKLTVMMIIMAVGVVVVMLVLCVLVVGWCLC